MDRPDRKAAIEDQMLDEAALDAFIRSDAFDRFMLDCFAEGVRDAVAEQSALELIEASAA
jgi:hypothetical protein